MRTRLRAPHRFSFQPPVRMIAYLGHKCSGPIEIFKECMQDVMMDSRPTKRYGKILNEGKRRGAKAVAELRRK